MEDLIDVPAGLHNVAVTDTEIGDVHGDEGFYHYRQYDATELARLATFEDVWYLFERGELPSASERDRFRVDVAALRAVPGVLDELVDVVARTSGDAPLAQLRTVLSASAAAIGAGPMLDVDARTAGRGRAPVGGDGAGRARRGCTGGHRGLPGVQPEPSLGHAAAYLHAVTGQIPLARPMRVRSSST